MYIDYSFKSIETQKFTIRQLNSKDLDGFHDHRLRSAKNSFNLLKSPFPREESLSVLYKQINNLPNSHENPFIFIIVDKKQGHIWGECKLTVDIIDYRQVELQFIYDPILTHEQDLVEISRGLFGYIFESLQKNKVRITIINHELQLIQH